MEHMMVSYCNNKTTYFNFVMPQIKQFVSKLRKYFFALTPPPQVTDWTAINL